MVVGEASKLCNKSTDAMLKSTDAKLGSFTHYAAKMARLPMRTGSLPILTGGLPILTGGLPIGMARPPIGMARPPVGMWRLPSRMGHFNYLFNFRKLRYLAIFLKKCMTFMRKGASFSRNSAPYAHFLIELLLPDCNPDDYIVVGIWCKNGEGFPALIYGPVFKFRNVHASILCSDIFPHDTTGIFGI